MADAQIISNLFCTSDGKVKKDNLTVKIINWKRPKEREIHVKVANGHHAR